MRGRSVHRAGDARPTELTTEQALAVVRELADLGAEEVVLIGGEAYLHPGFLDIARALAASGHLHDALTLLESIRQTDPQKADADSLRGEIQRQLLALTSLPPVAPPDAEKADRRLP